MLKSSKWEKLFGFKKRDANEDISQNHSNLALAIQEVTEEIVLNMAREAKRITGMSNICLAGGVSLNCVANGRLEKENIFDKIFIQPASGDAGGALGAALAYSHIGLKNEYIPSDNDTMKGSYLGPEFTDEDIFKVARKFGANYNKIESFNELTSYTAKLISEDNVVGWFRGRMEFGPRALGNRSIIADPRNPETQKKLNLKIKYREGFRPFAPSVLAEDTKKYFELKDDSPYMLLVADVTKDKRKELPEDYEGLELMEKLYVQRSDVPAITHCDFSARIQTVHSDTNPDYHSLISAFKYITGVGLVVNTSFNVRGEPIVCTPEEAFSCFMRTEMDVLVMQNYIFEKKSQNINKAKFEKTFRPD